MSAWQLQLVGTVAPANFVRLVIHADSTDGIRCRLFAQALPESKFTVCVDSTSGEYSKKV